MSAFHKFWKAMGFPSDRTVIKSVREKLSQRPQLDASAFAASYFPEEKREIAAQLYVITQRLCPADLTGMAPTDRFVEDFRMDELDSMSLLGLTIDVEKHFGIEIPNERAVEIRTFSELVHEIWRRKHTEP